MPGDILISARRVSRDYGPLRAVNDLTFDLPRGQVLGFLGPNGAGKSTTMQILSGVLAPSSGQVEIAGHDLLDEPLAAKAAIGYLPEQPPLYRELRVDEYLNFCARLHRIPAKRRQPAIDLAAQQCGLEQVMRRLIGNLSKGYQQRVGIAQAILHRPPVVILDEPTVGLDPIQVREIRALIRQLGEERGVILSTHILPEVQAVCSHVLLIRRGQVVLHDTIASLSQQTTTLKVGWRCPPAAETLLAWPGIESIERLDALHWRIRHHAKNNPAERLVEASVNNGWGLFELTPEAYSLEQLFVELTTTD
jgi:ABC-2 type transport system ATP-binding protein